MHCQMYAPAGPELYRRPLLLSRINYTAVMN